jgi:hypothetical protein
MALNLTKAEVDALKPGGQCVTLQGQKLIVFVEGGSITKATQK